MFLFISGRKFNARKEDVDDMNYLGLRIYRLIIFDILEPDFTVTEITVFPYILFGC